MGSGAEVLASGDVCAVKNMVDVCENGGLCGGVYDMMREIGICTVGFGGGDVCWVL